MIVNLGSPLIRILPARTGSAVAVFASVLVLTCLCTPLSNAQQIPLPTPSPKALQRDKTISDLDALAKDATLSEDKIKELDASIEGIKKDETAITAALIQSTKTARKLSEDIAAIEERLQGQREEEETIHASLRARRGVLAEVLGALERIGLNPPPAILVKPEDALSSVRSAILLGAVVPELRTQTDALVVDLDALKRITTSIANERSSLLTVLKNQSEERHRLDALVAEKSKLRAQSEAQRTAEANKVQRMAEQAKSLKDLIASLDADLASEKNAAERQRRDDERRLALERERAKNNNPSDTRLTPGIDLASLKGSLVLPVAGNPVKFFGKDNDFGGTNAGTTFAATPLAVVASPVDATILYAGPFRSYKQLLILDAGSGYHVVLGGMERIMVSTGQFVLSGEPIGVMAAKAAPSPDTALLTAKPELYIEFRKDGKPVDSAPWWTKQPTGRTQNDT
jgi:murein hydrolase activator